MGDGFGLLSFDWNEPLSDEDRDKMLGKAASMIRKWRMEVPAILFLESAAPLGHVTGQGLVAFSPFAAPLFPGGLPSVQKLHVLLEQPANIQRLINMLTDQPVPKVGQETDTDAARK